MNTDNLMQLPSALHANPKKEYRLLNTEGDSSYAFALIMKDPKLIDEAPVEDSEEVEILLEEELDEQQTERTEVQLEDSELSNSSQFEIAETELRVSKGDNSQSDQLRSTHENTDEAISIPSSNTSNSSDAEIATGAEPVLSQKMDDRTNVDPIAAISFNASQLSDKQDGKRTIESDYSNDTPRSQSAFSTPNPAQVAIGGNMVFGQQNLETETAVKKSPAQQIIHPSRAVIAKSHNDAPEVSISVAKQGQSKFESTLQNFGEGIEGPEAEKSKETRILASQYGIESRSETEKPNTSVPTRNVHTQPSVPISQQFEMPMQDVVDSQSEEFSTQNLREVSNRSVQQSQPTSIAASNTTRSIAQQLVATIKSQDSTRSEIQLNPKELGSVRMQLVVQDTTISMTILAERQETNDLMRRNIETLTEEFKQLGYDSIAFSFGNNDQSDGSEQHDQSFTSNVDVEDGLAIAETIQEHVISTGLDLRL